MMNADDDCDDESWCDEEERVLCSSADEEEDEEETATRVQQTIMPARRTGLNSLVGSSSGGRFFKRRRSTTHPVWTLVQKVNANGRQRLQCRLCNAVFAGGATRAAEHILGTTHPTIDVDPLSQLGSALSRLKSKLAESSMKKQRAAQVQMVNAVARREPAGNEEDDDNVEVVETPACRRSPRLSPSGQQAAKTNKKPKDSASITQRSLEHSLYQNAADAVDKAIGKFFFACNIPAAVIEHPNFRSMVKTLKCAPTGYCEPNRKDLLGSILDEVCHDLRVEEQPIRKGVMEFGGTACSDGWDTVERDHLINLLVGTCKGMFFDGTYELSSSDHEDAATIAELLSEFIIRTGKLSIVQICTDTCSVMQAAWKIVCARFPWITATCCGTHVLNLELKDIGKIPDIAQLLEKVSLVLSIFWGRKRWPRKKLRELIKANHGKEFGLYRAKVTRFAGKFVEMSRMLRCVIAQSYTLVYTLSCSYMS